MNDEIDNNLWANNLWTKSKNFYGSWTGTIVIVLFFIFFVAQSFVIPTGSMKPTMLVGDALFGKKFSYGTPIPRIPWLEFPLLPDFNGNGHLIEGDKPKRGDIVIFRYPLSDNVHYVKRCVALGGDKIMFKNKDLFLRPFEGDDYIYKNYNKNDIVSINGSLWVKNPYKRIHPGIHNDDNTYRESSANFGPIIVKDKEFFMVGDNRDHSNDSRYWGSVAYKYVVGQPWFVFFSWEHRDYYDVLNSDDTQDIDTLKKICENTNVNDSRCRDKWKKYQHSARWDRVFSNFTTLEKTIDKTKL